MAVVTLGKADMLQPRTVKSTTFKENNSKQYQTNVFVSMIKTSSV